MDQVRLDDGATAVVMNDITLDTSYQRSHPVTYFSSY